MHAPLIALLTLAPLGAVTAQTCFFDTECFESEACQPAAFEVMTQGEPITSLVTEFGPLEVIYVDGFVTLAKGAGIVMTLAKGEDGTARASVHMKGPSVVTYLGACQTPPPPQVIQSGGAAGAVPAAEDK